MYIILVSCPLPKYLRRKLFPFTQYIVFTNQSFHFREQKIRFILSVFAFEYMKDFKNSSTFEFLNFYLID